jgi:hypothetical protein
MVEFYGNFGKTWINDSTFIAVDLYSQIYGTQIVENCQFKGSIFRPRGMSKDSEIRFNSFSVFITGGGFSLTRYFDGCNYGSAHNNTFDKMTSGISINDYLSNAPDGFLIKDNYFNSCEQGISGFQANQFKIISNDFMNCTTSAIDMQNCDNNIILRNRFVNCGIAVSGGIMIECKNDWDCGGCGNYWSFLDGNDTNGDGIFDEPYNISVGNLDRYPVSNQFFDIEQPQLAITTHTSGPLDRSYNRIRWEAVDDYGIVIVANQTFKTC